MMLKVLIFLAKPVKTSSIGPTEQPRQIINRHAVSHLAQ
jgi:hypothetical protein